MSRPLLPLKTYNLKDGNVLIVGGVVIGGYGKEGGLKYSYGSDRVEDVVGADGQVTVSVLNDQRMYAEITLMENSPASKELMALLRIQGLQASLPTGILPLAYFHSDLVNGDLVADAYAVFMNLPEPSKSRTVGEVTYKILLPAAAKTAVIGIRSF
jgi:hypothetical protein